MSLVLLIVLVSLLGFTGALVAAAETALTRMSRSRAEALIDEGRPGAPRLRSLLDRREQILPPVLFVGLACHLGLATLVAIAANDRWGSGGVAIVFVIELLVVFSLVEALPKTVALEHTDVTATSLAGPIAALGRVAPLRWLAGGIVAIANRLSGTGEEVADVSEDELLHLAEQAAASDAIDEGERELIESIIEFGDKVVREIMVPRLDMVSIEQGATVEAAAKIVLENGHTRMPVVGDGGLDDVVGLLHARDLLRVEVDEGADGDQRRIAEVLREPRFVPETKHTAELMKEMQNEAFHMAIVVDEHGGTAGLVTMEDLIEEVIGEIVDEFDVEPPMIERTGMSSYRVNGRVVLDDLEDVLAVELPEGEWSTVGGLIFSELGHVPEVGEELRVQKHLFEVERMEGRRIARVLVRPAPRTRNAGTEDTSEGNH